MADAEAILPRRGEALTRKGSSNMKRIVLIPSLILVLAVVLQAGSCTYT
jgi:hypothetical protein